MKQYLLPEHGNFYKANLHTHSTFSDGCLSPAELKQLYMEQGYSILAYTDHNVFFSHQELKEADFLPLNGIEYDIYEVADKPDGQRKVCHLCMIALQPDYLIQPFYHRTKFIWGNAGNFRDRIIFDDTLPDFEREYSAECINQMIHTGRENGFFVTYNHPTWSQESYPEYMSYHGMHAMEIYNHDCSVNGYGDYNPRVYDDMLKGGKKIFCIGADDNHNKKQINGRSLDSFGAFTMIKAERLEYQTITDALLAGHFYASEGPKIHSLTVENGVIRIECSPVERIALSTGQRRARCAFSETPNGLQEAEFRLHKDDIYVRLTLFDHNGKTASTNAYFIEDILL